VTQLSRPDPAAVLARLKGFQRDTVEYAFQRLFLAPDSTRRFLVADEVGLGKTLVARGVIARAIEHLWDSVPRIDIVYICSNAQIARQNINRLNITGDDEFELASRITMLPTEIGNLQRRREHDLHRRSRRDHDLVPAGVVFGLEANGESSRASHVRARGLGLDERKLLGVHAGGRRVDDVVEHSLLRPTDGCGNEVYEREAKNHATSRAARLRESRRRFRAPRGAASSSGRSRDTARR